MRSNTVFHTLLFYLACRVHALPSSSSPDLAQRDNPRCGISLIAMSSSTDLLDSPSCNQLGKKKTLPEIYKEYKIEREECECRFYREKADCEKNELVVVQDKGKQNKKTFKEHKEDKDKKPTLEFFPKPTFETWNIKWYRCSSQIPKPWEKPQSSSPSPSPTPTSTPTPSRTTASSVAMSSVIADTTTAHELSSIFSAALSSSSTAPPSAAKSQSSSPAPSSRSLASDPISVSASSTSLTLSTPSPSSNLHSTSPASSSASSTLNSASPATPSPTTASKDANYKYPYPNSHPTSIASGLALSESNPTSSGKPSTPNNDAKNQYPYPSSQATRQARGHIVSVGSAVVFLLVGVWM
ncbi:hypothetical protein P280DRAFT_85844 [Massarina eburnea CBS 473.64]|uniref:Uncharacterized protein n=1 Tax=Massarina eburnea CBS 473.64 TaxID=1395130 RepID=A0A6A6RV94_9PLEO|nr:hypothetical protein P280DRAFT_85844 [Massarina eburnea CBS 473.64]